MISSLNRHYRAFSVAFLTGAMVVGISVHDIKSHAEEPRVIPVPTSRPNGNVDGAPSFIPAPATTTIFPKTNARLSVSAFIGKDKKPVKSGMVWRIFGNEETADGKLPLLGTYSGGDAVFDLPSGYYYVHSSFGYAEQTKRIRLLPPGTESTFQIVAGGLRLNAAFREGDIIPAKDLNFEIAIQDGDTLKTLVTDVSADELIRLPAGQYHVTSRYGDINSEVTANVRIKSNELTELTLYQRGAEITLKLVSEHGGEALADTTWTVLTPAGDPVVNTVKSAFPSFVLAAGDYIAFARHDNKNYSETFTIESGIHRDVELIVK